MQRICCTVIFLFIIYSNHLFAEKTSILRYLVFTGEQGKVSDSEKESDTTPESAGYAVHWVFGNGIGFGCATMTTSGKIEQNIVNLQSDNIDITFTFGTDWSLTIGYGRSMTGKGEIFGDLDYVSSKVTGDSYMVLLGIPFIGGELIGGLRSNELEFGPFLSKIDEVETKRDKNIKNHSQHLMLGYGLHF